MPGRARRGLVGLAVAYALLAAAVGLVGAPVLLAAPPPERAALGRLLAALLLGVALLDVLRAARRRLAAQPPSALDAARAARAAPPELDPRFEEARDALRAAAWSQRYFEHGLWPRLLDLAARGPGRPAPPPPARSLLRRLLRRGPAPAALAAVLERLDPGP